VLGLYWRRATAQGALLAITGGVSSWIGCEIFAPEGLFPPQLVGLLCSLGGMLAGSLLPQWRGSDRAAVSSGAGH
jgi:Na+/proline symporter